MVLLYLIIGVLMLVAGAEMLVRGGGHLALGLRIPVLVVGLTVVAFGTSTPELVVSTTAALRGSTDMALANVNGSNIANIALVLGLAALVNPLRVDRRLMQREIPVVLGLQVLLPLLCLDGGLSRIDGAIFVILGIVYNVVVVRDALGRREAVDELDLDFEPRETRPLLDITLVIVGIGVLVYGGRFFIDGATDIARGFGMSERFIGLTVVALGTSAPELATGLVAAWRGDVDLALGNSIGSNIFNMAMVLGITAIIYPITIGDPSAWVDLGAAVAFTMLLVPVVINRTGHLGRIPGALMVAAYVGYILLS